MKRLIFLFALMTILTSVNVNAQVNPTPGTTQTDIYHFTFAPYPSPSSSNWHTFRIGFYHKLTITLVNETQYSFSTNPSDRSAECDIIIDQKESLGVKLWENDSKSFVYEVPNGINFLNYTLSIVLLTPNSSIKVIFEYD